MRPLLGLCGGAALLYTGQVEFYNYEARREAAERKTFSPNSGDVVLMNGLATGDLVLFSRRWYRYHLPEALSIKLHQMRHATEFDHVGVVVCDKFGVPSVFESTYFSGAKLRPFEARILHSKAQQILVLPLVPRDAIGRDGQEKLAQYAVACAEERSQRYHPLAASSLVSECYKKLGIDISTANQQRQQSDFFNTQLLLDRAYILSPPKFSFGPLVVARTR